MVNCHIQSTEYFKGKYNFCFQWWCVEILKNVWMRLMERVIWRKYGDCKCKKGWRGWWIHFFFLALRDYIGKQLFLHRRYVAAHLFERWSHYKSRGSLKRQSFLASVRTQTWGTRQLGRYSLYYVIINTRAKTQKKKKMNHTQKKNQTKSTK